MIPKNIIKSEVPHKPGVYIYKDSKGGVLYVGKAIDLFHRVSSYFNKTYKDLKTTILVEKTVSLETIIVQSELEALILEANLIKKYLPPYNIKLIDDKDYLYIKVTKEKFPKIQTARKSELLGSKEYFGPFPSSRTVYDTLKKLRKIFPWCSNPPQDHKLSRACFYYHLNLCPGPCAGKIDYLEYNKIINRFVKFMQGKKDELINSLVKEMEELSKKQEYEKAASIKKILGGINYLTQSTHVQAYLENPNFIEEQNKLALAKLQKDLNLDKLPQRIECFDISNIQGKEAVGSMVVLAFGEIDKSQYRKFKIHLEGKPNDTAMMAEMVRRRLKHDEWEKPQLILVDGGKGQVNAVKLVINNSKLEIPILGLAKRREWLYGIDGDIIKLSKSSLSLKLLQKIRDEAHRFAISYHRKLRDKYPVNVI